MRGYYVTGAGKAHKCCRPHTEVFKHKMLGTFNVTIPHLRIVDHEPSITYNQKYYWFIILTHLPTKIQIPCWAIRDFTSKQRLNRLELLTKEPIPEYVKQGELNVEIPERWSNTMIQKWAQNKYWFQSFDFAPVQRADSKHIWDKINIINWSGYRILDLGCHYGYFSFKASTLGGCVIGVDKNSTSLKIACTIRDHIIQQDIRFATRWPIEKKSFDIILYLSVHHQIDPNYEKLKNQLEYLKTATRKHLFIELIMPPMFPKNNSVNESEIDKIVNGIVLDRYKHKVRGIRKIYYVEIK